MEAERVCRGVTGDGWREGGDTATSHRRVHPGQNEELT